jgi:aldehyde:ferredoxin oxidoreductase
LPRRFLAEGLPDGASGGAVLPRPRLEAMVSAYYEARGWGADGSVPPEVVSALELADLGR